MTFWFDQGIFRSIYQSLLWAPSLWPAPRSQNHKSLQKPSGSHGVKLRCRTWTLCSTWNLYTNRFYFPIFRCSSHLPHGHPSSFIFSNLLEQEFQLFIYVASAFSLAPTMERMKKLLILTELSKINSKPIRKWIFFFLWIYKLYGQWTEYIFSSPHLNEKVTFFWASEA